MLCSRFMIALSEKNPNEFQNIKDFREVQTIARQTKRNIETTSIIASIKDREDVEGLLDLIPPDPEDFKTDHSSDSVSCITDESDDDESSELFFSCNETESAPVGRPGLKLNWDYLQPPSAELVATLPRKSIHVQCAANLSKPVEMSDVN